MFIILIILLISIYYIQQNNEQQPSAETKNNEYHYDYDVVIVGGGLSGLSSAYYLNNYDVLILEKESYLGGRIMTMTNDNLSYDLGAVFAYNPEMLPFAIESSKLIQEYEPIGVYDDDKHTLCDTVIECLEENNLKNDEEKIINAFFQTIHPGEIEQYISERQEDALFAYDIAHYKNGNQEVIKGYEKNINAEIELNATVSLVEDLGEKVKITYSKNDEEKIVYAKTVIVTPPAPIAKKLIKEINKNSLAFLDSVNYGQMIAIAIGIENGDFENFSYIVTPDLMTNTIIKHSTDQVDKNIIIAYITNTKSKVIEDESDEKIIKDTINIIQQFNDFDDDNILFTDIHRWWYGGTIISEEMFDHGAGYDRPSPRVFLAGDYTNLETRFPYGMYPAVLSGEDAAQNIKIFLEK